MIKVQALSKIFGDPSSNKAVRAVNDVNLTADGRLAVTCSDDNTMRLWGEKK